MTSPVVLWAWIWKPDSSDRVQAADVHLAGVALRVDLRSGRRGRSTVTSPLRERGSSRSALHCEWTSTLPESDVALNEKPQKPVAAMSPEPELSWTEERTPDRRIVPLEVSIVERHVVRQRDAEGRVAGTEHLVRAARDDVQRAVLDRVRLLRRLTEGERVDLRGPRSRSRRR